MGLSDEQKEEYEDCFKLFDKDEDGKIEAREIADVVRALGLNPSEPQVEEMVKKVSPKGGPVGVDAIFTVMDGHGIVNGTAEQVLESFKIFDNQGEGKILATEMKAVYCNMGEKFNEEEAEKLMKALPVDDKGYVDYAEWTKMIFSA
ncbi:Myosin light chain 1/3, skeletal muscle isoform [Seminavis robusta]|uniref:Calmodulin n=1 Tax=Seminavis robusta TaxID=568900 RepID=A0A9N8EI91_9STRA|nr:Myosin light chain 1/3, skeletal muscle isoform [Seminavis robusta]|eukprot:Sro1236_g255120.1 Myosin light chain 1/3, skeletal muscle isoform (147) ;mRNA; r:15668-16108